MANPDSDNQKSDPPEPTDTPEKREPKVKKDKSRGRRRPRSHREARELALMALCHLESYDAGERDEALRIFWDNPPVELPELALWIGDPEIRGFAERLLGHLAAAGDATDATIDAVSRRWRVARMDRIDRNLLRLAAAELRDLPETPRGVVLAEVVALADRYGSERSAPFVNGVAESLARHLRPENGGLRPGNRG